MQLTFRSKLLLGQLVLVAVVVLVIAAELDRSLSVDLSRQLDERLEQQARGAAPWLQQNRHPERLVARLADVVGAEVAIFDEDGQVLAASHGADLDGPVPSEVLSAKDGGIGRATRRDDEGRTRTYVAVRADDNLLRLAAPLSNIDATLATMRARLFYASLLGVLAAIGLSLLASAVAARPLRTMTEAAKRLARGDYDVELPPRTRDDFGVLSAALGTLATQLRGDMARIDALERVRRDFIANVSHELRTPVTAIQGFAETLLDEELDAASRREFLGAVHRQADRLAALVAGLLRLSRLEARAPDDIVAEPVDLRAIAEHVVHSAEARHATPACPIVVAMPAELMALADPLGMEQVLDNLIENAIKHGVKREGAEPAAHAVVRIEGGETAGDVWVAVVDEGDGIAAEHLPRLFERFYRVDAGRSRDRGGVGLGLAIVKHLCEAMQGSVVVESTPGEGTRFVVRLPRATATTRQPAAAPERAAAGAGQT
jgi:signal transduction histidine kinase